MSKQCPYCKNKKVGSFNDNVAVCTECNRVFAKSQLVDTILFDQITQSLETLADKLVYEIRSTDPVLGGTHYWWCSTIIPGEKWSKRKEAFTETLVKLKEVVK